MAGTATENDASAGTTVLGTDDHTLANAIRALAMDAVAAANSGHPGAPMGMADFAQILWREVMVHNPSNPHWFNRDRFVLSNGHGSMLLYALLHLSGYDLPMQELRQFRQLHSKTAGHPEFGITPGVETTTGPLGQGLANAVGMALAERLLAAEFNRDGHTVVDHRTFVTVGDGCLMEGISHEACSLAGTLGLNKLVALFDDNGISIDGPIEGWCRDDTPARFQAYGWSVIRDVNGHDPAAIRAALAATAGAERPTLICMKTVIGRGSPNQAGTHEVHGAPLSADEIAASREAMGWAHAPFDIPLDVYAAFDCRSRGEAAEQDWNTRMAAYREAFPALAADLERRIAGTLPADFASRMDTLTAEFQAAGEKVATRKASGNVLDAIAPTLSELVGGSADLTPSNNTQWKGAEVVRPGSGGGRYISYGVREFAMTAVATGMLLHGALRPYVGTFLVFSDYARNAVRMAALMQRPTILVYTHDSIGLGEDGPTHQPIEQTASLRLIPHLEVWRPADAPETAAAWQSALARTDGPSALLLSRQGLPTLTRQPSTLDHLKRGGYVLADADGAPDLVLIATGSEVSLAIDIAAQLKADGLGVRVVSMPCVERFRAQPASYRDEVLPPGISKRVAIEAGASAGWYEFVGLAGRVFGIDRFGESAPAGALAGYFGFTAEAVSAEITAWLNA